MELDKKYKSGRRSIGRLLLVELCFLCLLIWIPQQSAEKVNTTNVDQWGVSRVKFVKFNYLWTIKNFKSHTDGLYSPPFSSTLNNRYNWTLLLYPTGRYSSSYVSIFLKYDSGAAYQLKADYKISVLNASYDVVATFNATNQVFGRGGNPYGAEHMIHRSEVLNASKKILRNGELTVYAEVRVSSDIDNVHGDCNFIGDNQTKEDETSDHLEQFLNSRKFSDVTLATRGGSYPAHKIALSLRSRFFSRLFDNETEDNSVVEIGDVQPQLVLEFLRFLYTGRVENLDEKAEELLHVSDVYGVDALKMLTERHLCNAVNLENSIGILLLANRYGAVNLKLKALHFIAAHAADYLNTRDFRELEKQHPELIVEIFNAMVNNII